MKAIASIGAAIAVLGLFMSSIGAFVAAYGVYTQEWELATLMVAGVLVAIGGVTLTYMAQVVQGGINEYKQSQKAKLPSVEEAMAEAKMDEVTAARLSSMWQQEARRVRDILKDEGWDHDDDT